MTTREKAKKSSFQKPILGKAEVERRTKLHEKFIEQIKSISDTAIQMVVFKLGNEKFSIEISKIGKVVETPKISHLPNTPPYIPGIINIDGRGIIVLDLAHKLKLVNHSENDQQQGLYTVIVNSQRFTIGILVSEVPENVIVQGNQIQPTGLDLAGTPQDETYIKGLIQTKKGPLFFIDIDELIDGDRMEAKALNEETTP
ncbi:MAG: purine-binding chemotaxis protein CheW [Cyclobacteriaceae bacterium]